MRFVTDKEQIKPGLIIFRRGDVGHDNFYCRIRIQNEDRYKTISLRTSDRQTARDRAMDQDADIRFRVKHDVPVFNRSFAQVAAEYADAQQRRANAGEVSQARAMNVKNKVNGALDTYVGSAQIHLISQDRWAEYPLWRRENGTGRRNSIISDATIRHEMSIFAAIMNYAIGKKYIPASHRFEGMPKLKSNRRDEFTAEEYRKLHTTGRKWMKDTTNPQGIWYRQMCYNFMLIMCNTGMRPPEAKNLRWRDISIAHDKDGRELLVIYVSGKGKTRKLIAPKSVGDYFERVRALSKATGSDDRVFTIINGKPAQWLYRDNVEELLKYANLRDGPSGIPRTTYCFRHTYATMRLSAGVDVYILAQQMGTSVKMIEQHYGHVPPAHCEAPSAQLPPLRFVQPVPREAAYSVCPPMLAAWAGFQRRTFAALKPRPNGGKSWEPPSPRPSHRASTWPASRPTIMASCMAHGWRQRRSPGPFTMR